jgi:hypothetical protein
MYYLCSRKSRVGCFNNESGKHPNHHPNQVAFFDRLIHKEDEGRTKE